MYRWKSNPDTSETNQTAQFSVNGLAHEAPPRQERSLLKQSLCTTNCNSLTISKSGVRRCNCVLVLVGTCLCYSLKCGRRNGDQQYSRTRTFRLIDLIVNLISFRRSLGSQCMSSPPPSLCPRSVFVVTFRCQGPHGHGT